MFDKFNETARRAIFFSRYEAARLGSEVIGTEHVRVPECRAARDLAEYGVDYATVSQVLDPILREMKRRAEIEDPTPIRLRSSHYELLDQIADSMNFTAERGENRQALALAIFDAVAASGVGAQKFNSAADFRAQLQEALVTRWPGA